jgi:hypothetical protein
MNKICRTVQDKAEAISLIQKTEMTAGYRFEWTRIKRKRSLSSNNYMWLILTHAEQETGNSKEDLYSFFLDQHPVFTEKEILGKTRNIQLTSSQFNTLQMSAFIDNLRKDLAFIGVETPDADSDQATELFNYYRNKGLI